MNFKLKVVPFLVTLFMFISIQSIIAQGNCTFSVAATVTPVDCRANGVITVALSGADLSYMHDFMYKVYPQGANSSEYEFVTNNVISGLTEGTYTVEAKGFCELSGIDVSQTKSNVVVNRTVAYVEPDFSINPTSSRKTLNCIPTGMLYMQGIVKGKGPYTITLTKYPAAYTGDTIIYQGSSLSTTYQINNLPAGNYEVKLSDGCGSYVKQSGTIGTVSSDFYSNMVYPYYYDVSTSNTDCSTMMFSRSTPGSGDDLYYYASNPSLYYEYAIYYPGDNVSSLTWQTYPSSSVTFTSRYTFKQMRDDKTNKVPKIYVRVKGGSCANYVYSPNFMDANSNASLYAAQNCGTILTFKPSTNSIYGLLCYPYTWTVVNTATSATVATSNAPRYPSSPRDTVALSSGTYRLTLTDAEGYQIITTHTITNTTYITSTYSYKSQCYDSTYYYIYGYNGTSLAGATIQFRRDLTDSRIPTPPNSLINVPKTYTGNVYVFSNDYTKMQYVHTATTLPTGLTAYFTVTDSCGVARQVTFTGTSIYQYVKQPTLNITQSCGRAVIKATDLADVYKSVNTLTGASTSASCNLRVYTMPSGATATYSYKDANGYSYCRSGYPQDSIILSKAGTYRFVLSNSAYGYSTSYCTYFFDVVVDPPAFTLDEGTIAAYRCPGSSVGVGYISVKAKNGSGDYLYTLYSSDNLTTPLATSTTGVFTSWAASSTDSYTVKVEDLYCGRSFTHNIFVYDLGNATLAWPDGNVFRKCVGDRLKFHALALGETTYSWTGPGGWTSSEKDPEIPVATYANTGNYTVRVAVPGCTEAYVTYTITMSIADKVMYWNPEAEDNNWYNKNNWLRADGTVSAAVPAPCTTVHIAGNALAYPNLDKDSSPRNVYGYPSCDTIIYHYGSETIYPHYLQYNRARVQYNMNYYGTYAQNTQPAKSYDMDTYPAGDYGDVMPVMKRARWYSIAAPLKNITGGDFALAGYPILYQRLYNAMDPQRGELAVDGFTLGFNTQNQDLTTTGHAMALWIPDYDVNYIGSNDHTYLENLKGIIELPYFENGKIMANRPLHQYTVADSTSHFQYFDSNANLAPVNKWDTMQRGYKSYRFVFENASDSVAIGNIGGYQLAYYNQSLPSMASGSTTLRSMIGNPLMCHIDFDKIYAYNSDIIEDFYMIYNGATSTFETYRINGVGNNLTKTIAPMQGYIVTLKAGAGRNNLILPLEGSSSIVAVSNGALPKPRATVSDTGKGWIKVTGITDPIQGMESESDSVRVTAVALLNYQENNMPKVISEDGVNNAELFFLDSDGYLNKEVVNNTNPSALNLGLMSTNQNAITLKLEIGGDIIESAYLLDKVLGVTQDVTNGGYYKFTHRYGRTEAGTQGLDTDRFELQLTYKQNGINSSDNDNLLSVNVSNNLLTVMSSKTLSDIQIYDALGKKSFDAKNINSDVYRSSLSLPSGVYLVKIKLTNSTEQTRKIVIP